MYKDTGKNGEDYKVNLAVWKDVDVSSIIICQKFALLELCRYLTAYIWKFYVLYVIWNASQACLNLFLYNIWQKER